MEVEPKACQATLREWVTKYSDFLMQHLEPEVMGDFSVKQDEAGKELLFIPVSMLENTDIEKICQWLMENARVGYVWNAPDGIYCRLKDISMI